MTGVRSITGYWQELVTASLLGTDRRDPPEAPAGPLADLVADAAGATPSERMLDAVGACTAARRAGLVPLPPAPSPTPPEHDGRRMASPAASRRWRSIVREWPVLEDEWLAEVARRGRRVPPDVLVELLARHRADASRRARVVRLGGPLAQWLVDRQPMLAEPGGRRPHTVQVADPGDAVAPLPVAADLLALLTATAAVVIPVIVGGLRDGTFGRAHRAVLVNLVARMRPDALAPLAAALREVDPSSAAIGLAQVLADLASARHGMLQELCS